MFQLSVMCPKQLLLLHYITELTVYNIHSFVRWSTVHHTLFAFQQLSKYICNVCTCLTFTSTCM